MSVLRDAFGDAVAHERGRRSTCGTDAHPASDQAGAQIEQPVPRQLRPGLDYDFHVQRRWLTAETQSFFHGEQDFTDTEQTDDRDQEIEAIEHLLDAECEAELAGHLVKADGAKPETDHHRSHGLERRFLAQSDETAESQEIDRENLWRPETERKTGDQWRHQRDDNHREQRADEGRREGGGKGLAGATILRHWIAIERRRHRPRLAGNVEQDRCYRASEQRSPLDA